MAFHVACPLTCRKICYCTLGQPKPEQTREGEQGPLQFAADLAKFLSSPYVAYGGEETLEVLVPCLPKDVKNKQQKANQEARRENAEDGGPRRPGIGRKVSLLESTVKADEGKKNDTLKLRVKLHLAGAESGPVSKTSSKSGTSRRDGLGRQGPKISEESQQPQVVCELCSCGEILGTEREQRMFSCQGCKKRYHRRCVKHWAEFRDLFNWRSWVCGSCRSCEVCRRTGEPNKLMFCKRCDAALHVYCQQPPLRHVPKGPYLCPKHSRCHSCSSHVPGSGMSSKWFLSFTTCDACGRLFVKDKYCPVCLKVYRDSEATPMVCCDNCEHWVHCRCDGISDDEYLQFQTDDNLRYKCPACRGDCEKMHGLEDAVRELWRRRDKADVQQMAKLAAAAGLPPPEENVCPSSDDEKQPPSLLSKKAWDSSTEAGRKPKKDMARLSDKHGENARKKIVLQKINLKRPMRSAEEDIEESNDERDSVNHNSALTSSYKGSELGAVRQRMKVVDTGRARSHLF